jgi:hypothetical protein
MLFVSQKNEPHEKNEEDNGKCVENSLGHSSDAPTVNSALFLLDPSPTGSPKVTSRKLEVNYSEIGVSPA